MRIQSRHSSHTMPAKPVRRVSGSLSAWFSAATKVAGLVIGSVFLSSMVCPPWLDLLETAKGRPIEYEAALRFYLVIAMWFALSGSALFCWRKWTKIQQTAWRALLASAVILSIIFSLDWSSLLMEEQSWIRYPTAVALFLSGCVSAWIAFRMRQMGRPLAQYGLWCLLGTGFALGGTDEVLQLHEWLGRTLGKTLNASFLGDLITLSYAVFGFATLCLIRGILTWNSRRKGGSISAKHKRTLRTSYDLEGILAGFVAATAVFGIAQLFDTGDRMILKGLRSIAHQLLSAGHQFPDLWYLFYRPRQLLNSIEEVLECGAGMLFLAFVLTGAKRTLSVAGEPKRAGREVPPLASSPMPLLPRLAFLALILLLVAGAWPVATLDSPLAKGAVLSAKISHKSAEMEPGSQSSVGERVVLPGGRLLESDFSAGAILYLNQRGEVLNRLLLRRMHRDLRGIGADAEGRLVFVTGSGDLGLVPPILWRMPLARVGPDLAPSGTAEVSAAGPHARASSQLPLWTGLTTGE